MPISRGFYAGGAGQRVGEGIADAAGDLGDSLMAGHQRDQQQQRELARQVQKEMIDRVIAGQMSADEGEKALAGYGHPVRPGALSAFEPSVTTKMQNALAPVVNAKTPEDLPTTEGTNLGLASKGLNPITNSNVPDQFMADGGMAPDQLNPDAAGIMGAQRQKLTQIAASKPNPTLATKGMTGDGSDATPTEAPNFMDPMKPVGSQLTAAAGPIATGPSASQAGQFEGAKAVAAAPGSTEAELARTLGTTYSPEVTRAKAEQAYQEETARVKAQGDPAAIGTLRARTMAEAKAKSDAEAMGVPPQYASTMARHVADGRAYFVDDPAAPPAFKKAVYTAAANANMKVLNPKQAGALDDIQTARANLGTIMDTLAQFAPKDATGRILGGPTNTFDALSQRNPQLAAIKATMFAPTIALNRSLVTSGASAMGMRMSNAEIQRFTENGLSMTDDYPTLYAKVRDFNRFLSNAESTVLGR